jgi:transposase
MSALGTILSLNRRAKQEVSPEMRAAIIATVNAGVSQAQAGRTFGLSQQAVSYIIKRFKETGSLLSAPRIGRPSGISERNNRAIVRAVRHDFRSTREMVLSDLPIKISASTLRRTLNDNGIRKYKAKKKLILTKDRAKARLL